MNDIAGIGWIDKTAFGQVRLGKVCSLDDGPAGGAMESVTSLFKKKIENFGRFDPVSRMTCYASVLALHDAESAQNANPGTGIIGTGYSGSLAANYTYFKDYADAGRILARGNLFVYTLPSTPLAEAAIHFGFRGPTFSVTSLSSPLADGLAAAQEMLDQGAPAMLVVHAEATCAVAAVIRNVRDSSSASPLSQWLAECSGTYNSLPQLITNLSTGIQQGA